MRMQQFCFEAEEHTSEMGCQIRTIERVVLG